MGEIVQFKTFQRSADRPSAEAAVTLALLQESIESFLSSRASIEQSLQAVAAVPGVSIEKQREHLSQRMDFAHRQLLKLRISLNDMARMVET